VRSSEKTSEKTTLLKPPKPRGKKAESKTKSKNPQDDPIKHMNLKRDIKRNRPPRNQHKRKDRKPLAESKKPKETERKTEHQDQLIPQEITQYPEPQRPKRKLQERQEMYPSPKKKRKDCHDEKL
jgi:hypothetical protein